MHSRRVTDLRLETTMSMRCTLMRSALVMLMASAAVGCASFSNPTTHPSVPVRRLPEEVLGKPREEQVDIPQPLLRQPQPENYILDVGDTLGIVLDTIIGQRDQVPPIQLPVPGSLNQNVAVGYPFPVLEDGTISLPIVDPIKVKGLTIIEARNAIKNAYVEKAILKEEQVKLLVTLFRPRQYHVLVVRQDSGGTPLTQSYGQNSSKRGSGQVLDLPAYENDVLTALTRSGGLPGNDAKNEVLIQRGALKGGLNRMTLGPIPGIETVRIPLRLRPGEPVPFRPEDVILENGDIVFIQSRDTEVFYTGGLIQPGEFPIPRDSDLDVLEAVLATRGPIANGGLNQSNLSGNVVASGFGSPSPSQLTVIRKAPGNRQILIRVDLNRAMQDPRERILVQPGDVLILQETLGESLVRYTTQTLRFTFISRIFQTSSSSLFSNGQFP